MTIRGSAPITRPFMRGRGVAGEMKRFLILVLAALSGLLLGSAATAILGVEHFLRIPALGLALSRAITIARGVFGFLRWMGLSGVWALTFSIGAGIFLNNLIVLLLILASPILILKAKPFSDKYIGRLYQRYGIWLFKPIGWGAYRVLASIIPAYALALQFYLIGGTILVLGFDLGRGAFLIPELAAILAACMLAIQPCTSDSPLDGLRAYFRKLKLSLPLMIVALFIAAILEAYQLTLL